MELDTTRFGKLLTAITVDRGASRELGNRIAALHQQRHFAASELDRAKERAEHAGQYHGVLVRDGNTGVASTTEIREQAERAAADLADRLVQLDAERRRLQSADAEVSKRLGAAQDLERRCRAWATEHGVSLPGELYGGPRGVTVPRDAGGREFGGGWIC